ncbi:cytochrome c oxidase assembly protein subunit 15 [Agromyces hippuratus]|uniref:Cytochrome c oxidase assembly protein subunit 15 n=1 Tax=Agromyces hippuratus TaxID=286438 RepID=A0A852WQR7_9MICO|nr:COX15/CtaA family protein [Agromyces hippuratus]NYG20097.1 cytochrome c oxidase assembly protein subunit 15 [Agromyces hippuratus]
MTRTLRIFAWASFVAQVTIIATGGAVRLTGSGLGCPTWPTCTAESLVPTDELTYHSLIEFGNRMMTGVVGIIALIVFVLVWRIRRERRDLFVLSFIVGVGIVAQAIVGGITVWTGLNPFIVGFHYVSSLALVCVTAAFLARMDAPAGPRESAVPGWYASLTHLTSAVLLISIVFGVLTTGSGPHSGDAAAGRSGFDSEILEHVHAWPGYALVVLTLALVVAAWRLRLPTLRWSIALLAIELVQVGVGLYQARNGLPAFAVGVHMVLAALTAAAMTIVIMRLKRPMGADAAPETGVEPGRAVRTTPAG